MTSVLLFMPHVAAAGSDVAFPGSQFSANIETKVVIDSRGEVHFLWAVPALNGSGPAPGIWYSKYDPNATDSISPILIRNSTFVQSADMAVDKSGNPRVTWVERQMPALSPGSNPPKQPESQLYYAVVNSTDPRRFVPTVLTGVVGLVMWPSIVMDSNQTAYIVWTRADGGKTSEGVYYGLLKSNATINQVVSIAAYNGTLIAAPRPHIAYDIASDDLDIAWTERAELSNNQVSSSIGYAKLDLKWKNVTKLRIASLDGLLDDAKVAVGPRGNAYVVWQSAGTAANSNFLYVAQISGHGNVNFVKQLTRPGSSSTSYLTMSTDSQDNLYVVWYQPSSPIVGSTAQVTPTSTTISYLKLDGDGSLAGTWNDVVPQHVIAVTFSKSGDVYALSLSGIIHVPISSSLINIQLLGVVLALCIGIAGVSAVEDFRYRLIRPIARVTRRREHAGANGFSEEQDGVLRVLSRNPGLRVRDLRHLLPRAGPTMIKLALLERQGYVSSVRIGLKRRFYYSGQSMGSLGTACYEAIPSRIVHEIERNPGIWEAKLAQNLQLSQQIVHYHLRKLQVTKILTAQIQGKRRHYTLLGSDQRKSNADSTQ